MAGISSAWNIVSTPQPQNILEAGTKLVDRFCCCCCFYYFILVDKFWCFFFFFSFFCLFRATSMAYGSFQTKGQIGAVAASLHHSHSKVRSDLSLVCDLHCSLQQCQIPDPLREARDRTCILMEASRICFCCATEGTFKSIS